jgi:hypothetical protein
VETELEAKKLEAAQLLASFTEKKQLAEAAEFQVTSVSQEYRKLLQQNEEELRSLRSENLELKQAQLRVSSGGSAGPSTPSSDEGGGLGSVGIEIDDIGDALSSQNAVNQLSAQLKQVQAECVQWKQKAEAAAVAAAGSTSTGTGAVTGTTSPLPSASLIAGGMAAREGSDASSAAAKEADVLRAALAKMEQQQQHALDQHQEQLAAMQEMQTDRLGGLTAQLAESDGRRAELESELEAMEADGPAADSGAIAAAVANVARLQAAAAAASTAADAAELARAAMETQLNASEAARTEASCAVAQLTAELVAAQAVSSAALADAAAANANVAGDADATAAAAVVEYAALTTKLAVANQQLAACKGSAAETVQLLTEAREREQQSAAALASGGSAVENQLQALTVHVQALEAARDAATEAMGTLQQENVGTIKDRDLLLGRVAELMEAAEAAEARSAAAAAKADATDFALSAAQGELAAVRQQQGAASSTAAGQLEVLTSEHAAQQLQHAEAMAAYQKQCETVITTNRDAAAAHLQQCMAGAAQAAAAEKMSLEQQLVAGGRTQAAAAEAHAAVEAELSRLRERLSTDAVGASEIETLLAEERAQRDVAEAKVAAAGVHASQLEAQLTAATAAAAHAAIVATEAAAVQHQHQQIEVVALQSTVGRLEVEVAAAAAAGQASAANDGARTAALEAEVHAQLTAAVAAKDAEIVSLATQLSQSSDVGKEQAATHELLQQVTAEKDRAANQLQKLTEHLMQLEETSTADVLELDGHVKQLTTALAEATAAQDFAEAKAATDGSSAEVRIRTLEDRAASAIAERDGMRSDMVRCQSENDKLSLGLSNLEQVLQGFQAEKEAQEEVLHTQVGSNTRLLKAEAETATVKAAELETALSDAHAQLDALTGVQRELNISRGLQKSMEADTARLQTDLSKQKVELADRVASISERLIDKTLISNMFVQYCEQSGEHKYQVLQLMCNALALDEADRYAVGIRQHRGFFSSLIAGPAAVPETPEAKQRHSHSFAQDLVDFMMTEAEADSGSVGVPTTPSVSPRQSSFPAVNPRSGLAAAAAAAAAAATTTASSPTKLHADGTPGTPGTPGTVVGTVGATPPPSSGAGPFI